MTIALQFVEFPQPLWKNALSWHSRTTKKWVQKIAVFYHFLGGMVWGKVYIHSDSSSCCWRLLWFIYALPIRFV